MEYRINLEIHTLYAVPQECCQESYQCEHLDHVKFRSQPTLNVNSRSRPRHEVDQDVSMVSALFQVERDKYDHYSCQTLHSSVTRQYLCRGIYSASSCGVTFINIYYLHNCKVSIPVFNEGVLILI